LKNTQRVDQTWTKWNSSLALTTARMTTTRGMSPSHLEADDAAAGQPALPPAAGQPALPPDAGQLAPESVHDVDAIELPPGCEDHDPYTGLPPGAVRVDGGYMCGGRFIRHVQGTSRVPWNWPEAWQRLSRTTQNKFFQDWELIQRRLATARARRPPIPAMPIQPHSPAHREHVAKVEFPFNAAVARPVSKAEVRKNPKSDAALLNPEVLAF
jgi:hypothetical protein